MLTHSKVFQDLQVPTSYNTSFYTEIFNPTYPPDDARTEQLSQYIEQFYSDFSRQFAAALRQEAIQTALLNNKKLTANAIYPDDKIVELNQSETQYALHLTKTADGVPLLIIRWTETNALEIIPAPKKGISAEDVHGQIYDSYLHLSPQEIIFIPAPKKYSKEEISLYRGYISLYCEAALSLTRGLTYEFIKEISRYSEVVEMIGRNDNPEVADPNEKILMQYGRDIPFVIESRHRISGRFIRHEFTDPSWLERKIWDEKVKHVRYYTPDLKKHLANQASSPALPKNIEELVRYKINFFYDKYVKPNSKPRSYILGESPVKSEDVEVNETGLSSQRLIR